MYTVCYKTILIAQNLENSESILSLAKLLKVVSGFKKQAN